MATVSDTVLRLQGIISDENCRRMNMSTVKGFLGELIVREQLERANFNVEHHGNQTGYDLSVGPDAKFKIDVKTSTLKNELSDERSNWGWALVHSNKKKPISATHFVCVGLDNNFNASLYIIIPSFLATRFPQGLGQFPGVKHAFYFFPEGRHPSDLSQKQANCIRVCEKLLQDKSIKVLHRGQSFRNLFS